MKIKNKEQRSLWYKKIFYYLKSGQSLPESIRVAATDADTLYIYEELVDGLRFSDVCILPNMHDSFTKTEISLLRVAEQTGTMQSVCDVLARMLKSQYEQSQRLMAAMIYPVLVLCMACGLLLMILTVVVPKIAPLFSSMKHIPMATKILIYSSNHVIHFWYVDILLLLLCTIMLIYLKQKTTYIRALYIQLEHVCMHIPYIKDVYMFWFIERWMQVVHLSLQSKVSLVQALNFGTESVSNMYLQSQFKKVADAVERGNSCSEGFNVLDSHLKNKLKDWISVISSGEKTGTLEEVFGVSHEHITSNLKESFDRFQKIIEPLLIVLVGIMVLCICLAIILPMYQLTQSVQ